MRPCPKLSTSRFARAPKRGTRVIALSSVLCAAPAVHAQAVADADAQTKTAAAESITVTGKRVDDSYTVQDTAAATKLSLTPRETPQSMTVITRERMQDQQLDSLRAVLDATPGVYSNAYDSERVLFYSRGFLIDSLMVDGVPALANFNTGSVDETLDTALYERIEIVRGATGLMTGAGSPAASVNVVRKHADSRSTALSADVSLGSWQNRRAEADLTVPLNADASVRGRFVAAAEDDRSYQALYHKKKYVGYGIVDADVSAQTRVSLGFEYQDNRPRSNTWGSFPLFLSDGSLANWPRSVTTATDWSYWNRQTQTVFGELRHAFDNGWSVRASVSHRRYDEDLELFYVFGYPDVVNGQGLEPYAYKSRAKITENALDLYASGPFRLFGRAHELVVGYNGSRAHNDATIYDPGDLAPVGNFFAWDGRYPRPAFAAESTRAADIGTDQDGWYAVSRFSLADALKLIAGARYARWHVDSYYLYDDPVDSSYGFDKVIPYAGLVWDVLPNASLFASYTGIFKPQNERDVRGRYLDPVVGRSYELGVKGEHFGGRANTSFTVFQTLQDNVAAPAIDPATGAVIRLPDGSTASQASDGVRTRGFEFEATGRIDSEWQGSIGWTRYLMKDADGQAVRTFIPNTLVRLFATWEPSRWVDGLRLGAGIDWQSVTRTPVGSPTGGTVLRQASVLQLSLMARWQLTPQVALQLNGKNVTDRKFYVLDEYDNTYYGAPANYTASLHVTY